MLEARAFEPSFLKRLDSLILGTKRSRTQRAGRRNIGRHLGAGIEPENFREYAEGDDLRFLDWNTFARLDNLTIRTFRAERQVEITILIDASASMAVPAEDDKLGLALALGASLAYVGMSENDPVRLAVFGADRGGVRITSTPFHRRREAYGEFRSFVTAVRCGGETRLEGATAQFLTERRAAGIVILISDFLVNTSDYENALIQLTTARHEVKALHVLGEHEAAGKYPPGAYRIRDCETGAIREVVFGARAAAGCQQRVAEHSSRLRGFCASHGVDYAEASGAARLEDIVAKEFPRLGVIV